MKPSTSLPAVGYLPPDEENCPQREVDSIIRIVFSKRRTEWHVESIWLTDEEAVKATKRFKQRPTQIIRVYVPGLLYAAIAKLRNNREEPHG